MIAGLHRLGDNAHDPPARVQGGLRILEDHLDRCHSMRARLFILGVGNIATGEDYAPGCRLVQADRKPADGGLAAAALADDAEELARVKLEGNAAYRIDAVSRVAPKASSPSELLR